MPKPLEPAELRMSLLGHLEELRGRILKCVIAVLVLGAGSLVFARPIFWVLMKPVLAALPADNRALIYTSGIEELNVLMKVGLYCGIFLTTPVILWQLWSFVSPGLYPQEKKLAAPFILFGTGAFVGGALFCYFVLLPSMMQFLLQEGDSAPLQARLDAGRLREAEAVRYLRLGEPDRAGALAKAADEALTVAGEGKVDSGEVAPDRTVELTARLDGLGRVIDAAADGFGASARPVLRMVMERRLAAVDALAGQNLDAASAALDEAASLLAGVAPDRTAHLAGMWKLEKNLALGQARHVAQTWTKPMLTMSENLSLVLLLELAFGIIFELPLVMALLAMAGLIRSGWLMKYQRHAFVVCLVAAAVITPTGDAVNLALMAGPMLLCFEVGVLAVWAIERSRPKTDPSSAITPSP